MKFSKSISTDRYYHALKGIALLVALAALACNMPISGSEQTAATEAPSTTQTAGNQPIETMIIPPAITPSAPPVASSVTVSAPTVTATVCTYDARFVTDLTIPDGTEIVTGSGFTKSWRIKNAGCKPWPDGTVLVYISGNQMSGPITVPVPTTAVGGNQDIPVPLKAPDTPGDYTGYWQLRTPDGLLFGDRIYVKIKAVAPAATSPADGPTATSVPVIMPDFTAGYASTWSCSSIGRVSFKIVNQGSLPLESLEYSIEGPVGTHINGASTNTPFWPSPPPVAAPDCMQAGAESLAAGGIAWINLVGTAPTGGTAGQVTLKMCSQNNLGGTCKTITVPITF